MAANNVDSDEIVVVVTTLRLRCADLTYAEAQRQLAAGATYLDADDDGVACEANAGGGSLPSTGLAVGVLLVLAGGFVVLGGGLRTAAADRIWRRRSR